MRLLALVVATAIVAGSCGPAGSALCPPPGPWPQPPGCGGTAPVPGGPGVPAGAGGQSAPGALAAPSFTALVQPRYPAQRGAFVFPPSCDMLPDTGQFGMKIARIQCQDFKKGAMVFWKEEACVAMPFEAGNQACRDEREVLRKLGAENAAKMRAADPGWWRTPYLNTYVKDDIRIRTEELQPTARIWAGGTYWGWRDDEIFMSHAAGLRVIPSHSFVNVAGAELDGMRAALLKTEGVTVNGPQDMQKPEYLRIKTDLKYLQQHSPLYQQIVGAALEHDYTVKKDPTRFTSFVPLSKLANAKERPATNEQVMGDAAEAQLYAKLGEPLRSDVLRLMIMESAAAHSGNHYIRATTLRAVMDTTNEDAVYLALEDRTDLAAMKKAFGFIQRYHDTYRDVAQSSAKVALVYDNVEVAREWREELKADHQGAVLEAARALWAKNVEFDVVSWKQLAERPHATVVLAPSQAVSADRAAQVAALRTKGVKVYALWQLPAGVAVEGKVYGDDVAQLGGQGSPPLALPSGVRSLRYVDGKGGTIVHLMNYDVGADGFHAKAKVRIDPAYLDGATSVAYATLEHPDLVPLDPKDPLLPELTTYALVVAKR